tara:strand:+ start:31758 stop:32492 length:735 start_codon:yes stop_codon:yes gene_type:complete
VLPGHPLAVGFADRDGMPMTKGDNTLLAFAVELRDAHVGLQGAIDDARNMDHVSLPLDGAVGARDVVDYARRISYTTFAPAGYEPGAPLFGAVPPAPQDEHFGASHLARHASEVKQREQTQAAEQKVAEEARKASIDGKMPPLTKVIELLSSWKPGQPWPAGIPPPPPGWKPGDPLHIGSSSVEDKSTTEKPLSKPDDALLAPKKPRKVVPFVQLDLNPDMDDLSDEFEEVSESERGSDSEDSF